MKKGRGYLAVRAGEKEEGLRLARRGLEAAESTDAVDVINRSLMLVAVCATFAGELDEAARAGASAIDLAGRKGDVAGAAWIRVRLAELGVAVPA